MKWSDGEDFTAEDIAFSIQLRKDNPELNIDFPDQYGDITRRRQQGHGELHHRPVRQPASSCYKLLIVPEHLWDDQDPVTWTDDDMIGTGPFTLKSFTPQAVTLEPNDGLLGRASPRSASSATTRSTTTPA